MHKAPLLSSGRPPPASSPGTGTAHRPGTECTISWTVSALAHFSEREKAIQNLTYASIYKLIKMRYLNIGYKKVGGGMVIKECYN